MELPGIRRLMEIKISAEQLIGAFARENHFDSHRLDDTGNEVHGGGCPDGGDIVGLQMVHDIRQCIQCLLDREMDLMVDRPDKIGCGNGRRSDRAIPQDDAKLCNRGHHAIWVS